MNDGGFVLTFPIRKIDAEKREVWGYATTEDLDVQGEIVDYDGSKRAFAEWTDSISAATGGKSMGNLREMHTPKAIGSVIAWKPDDARRGIWIGAKLSTSTDGQDAWTKVKEGVLTGFSIGAPKAERRIEGRLGMNSPTTRVVNYKLAEVSLVDNPACPGSFLQEVKLAKSAQGGLYLNGGVLDFLGVSGDPSGIEKNVGAKASLMNLNSITKEASVDIQTTVESADALAKGKNIGPQHTREGKAPGEQRPQVPTVENSPKPVTASDKAAEGKPGGPHAIASESISVPDGQGKAADGCPEGHGQQMPGGPAPSMPPPASAMPQKEAPMMQDPNAMQQPPMRYGFCAMCGSKMAAAESFEPTHKACKDAAQAKAAASSADLGGMSKAMGSMADSMHKFSTALSAVDGKYAAQYSELSKRVERLEAQPTPGGPMRTELPSGVAPVEKGAGVNAQQQNAEAILKSAMDNVSDPFLKDKLSIELAKMSMKSQFSRNA